MTVTGELGAFEAQLDSQLGWILDCASRSPPGGGHGWNQVLCYYGLDPDSALERLTEVSRTGQARGATLSEVRRALEALGLRAHREFERLGAALPGGQGPGGALVSVDAWDRMRARLSMFGDQTMARYTELVCPARATAAGVGQVFANARNTSARAPWAGIRIDPARVLECPHCGGPQEIILDFTCRYCRGSMQGSNR